MRKCPKCKKDNVAEIIYGYCPMPILEENSDVREFTRGGCIITDNDPRWSCIECGHEWGRVNHDRDE